MDTRQTLLPCIAVGGALLAASALAAPAPAPVAPPQSTIDAAKSLMITKVEVVDDARARGNGAWSFGTVMRELAGDVPAERFVEAWIQTLVTPQDVNNDPNLVNANSAQQKRTTFQNFFDAWRTRSGGVLDLDSAPFRLCAIVHRPDLMDLDGGQVTTAGEGRLVYCMVDPANPSQEFALTGQREALVIVEYGIAASSCEEVQAWNQRWAALSDLPQGTVAEIEAYNAALQDITDDFVMEDATRPGLNGATLNQLRLNSFALDTQDTHWDLREWKLESASGLPRLATLAQHTTAQTPSFRYLRRADRRIELARWLQANTTAILDGSHEVGLTTGVLDDRDFLGGRAINDSVFQGINNLPPNFPNGGSGALPQEGSLWWAPGYAPMIDSQGVRHYPSLEAAMVRHNFALQTCQGCHFWESGTSGTVQGTSAGASMQRFRMIQERETGQQSKLSVFLTGTEPFLDMVNPLVVKPIAGGGEEIVELRHEFNDLARRTDILERILAMDCTQTSAARSELSSIRDAMGSRVH